MLCCTSLTCSDYKRMSKLSQVIISSNGSLTTTSYTSFLVSSVLVTGAIVASTSSCVISDEIAFNVSTQDTDLGIIMMLLAALYATVKVH